MRQLQCPGIPSAVPDSRKTRLKGGEIPPRMPWPVPHEAGRQKGYVEMYRGIATEVNLLKKIRLELAVPDETVKTAIEAIMTGARTGKEGDGVVFVLDVAENYRIRTGESM